MVSREGLEPSYPEGPVSETVAYAIPPPGHDTERGNRTHLVRLVEPVLSQRASSAWWGSRESNTGRAPYQRAQVNRTVLPLNSSAELLLNTSLFISGGPPGNRTPPQALIRRRRSTRSCGPPAGATSTSAPDGTGPGNRTHARPGCRPGAVSSWLAPRKRFGEMVEVAGFEPAVPASRTRCSNQIEPHLDGRDGGNRTLTDSLMRAASHPEPSRYKPLPGVEPG